MIWTTVLMTGVLAGFLLATAMGQKARS